MGDPTLARSLNTLGIALLVLTGVVLLVMVILIFVSVRWARGALEHWTTPDPAALRAKLAHLRAQNPGLSGEELVHKVIEAEARKVGLVGALTGLGGFATLPIAIPVDFAVSARLQAAMVHFIATIQAPGESERTLKLTTYALMAGSGFTRDLGVPMAALLEQALTCGIAPGHVRRLLRAFRAASDSGQTKRAVPPAGLVEVLSQREIEVLRLLTGGLSNQEIANRLCVSANTVKTHLASIYGKLGATGRREAVNKARSAGLLV